MGVVDGQEPLLEEVDDAILSKMGVVAISKMRLFFYLVYFTFSPPSCSNCDAHIQTTTLIQIIYINS